MKAAKTCAIAALVMCVVAIAPVRGSAGETTGGHFARSCPDTTLFAVNANDVTAYPACQHGDVPPVALTTDMADPAGFARDTSGRIYVVNAGTDTITIYAAGGNGNVTPIAVIGGPNTGIANPRGIALDASGAIYVVNNPQNSRGYVTVYPALGGGSGILDEAPTALIGGARTLLDSPDAIAVDEHGDLYVANNLGGPIVRGEPHDKGRVTIYAPGSKGNVAPVATISGAATGLASPIGIALDAGGDIYVANSVTANLKTRNDFVPSVTVYTAGSDGNAAPIATIAGGNTDMRYPNDGIALDSSGNLYLIGYANGVSVSVNVYSAGSNGDVAPAASIAGAATGMADPVGLMVDSSGNRYVLNNFGGPTEGGSITVYAAGSSGDSAPSATITNSITGLEFAKGVALDSGGNIYVANDSVNAVENGNVEIYPAGSYAVSAPFATIAGDDTGLDYPLGIALDSSGDISVLNIDKTITVYPAGSAGNVTPEATIEVDRDNSNAPSAIAIGPRDVIYVVNQGVLRCNGQSCAESSPGSVAAYPAGSDGEAKPIAVIGGLASGIATPTAVAIDRRGDLYVTNEGADECMGACCNAIGPGSVTVYPPGSNGNTKPIATISGMRTGLGAPRGIALDPSGNIYVLNTTIIGGTFGASFDTELGSSATLLASKAAGASPSNLFIEQTVCFANASIGGRILIFAPGSNGDVAPIATIGGPLTGLNGPAAIAIWPGGP